jgi:hypothetical protein
MQTGHFLVQKSRFDTLFQQKGRTVGNKCHAKTLALSSLCTWNFSLLAGLNLVKLPIVHETVLETFISQPSVTQLTSVHFHSCRIKANSSCRQLAGRLFCHLKNILFEEKSSGRTWRGAVTDQFLHCVSKNLLK